MLRFAICLQRKFLHRILLDKWLPFGHLRLALHLNQFASHQVALSRVCLGVLDHVVLANETLGAFGACVRFVTGVHAIVSSQIRSMVERLAAVRIIAWERLVALMTGNVCRQSDLRFETFAAFLTLESPVAAMEISIMLG